jgi:hypothetical protein
MSFLIRFPILSQGKEYVSVANSDNLSAIVDMSIQISDQPSCSFFTDLLIPDIAMCFELKIFSLTSTEILNDLTYQNEYRVKVCKSGFFVLLLSLRNIKLNHCIYFRLLK